MLVLTLETPLSVTSILQGLLLPDSWTVARLLCNLLPVQQFNGLYPDPD